MFSLECGQVKEQPSRAFFDDDDDEVESLRTFEESLPEEKKSALKCLFITTSPLTQAFVSIYLSTDHKPQTIGQIRSSDGHCVGTYSTLADGVVSLLVNEGLLTCHDANNVTETIFKNLPSGLSIYIIHSVHDRTICMGVEENIVRCLKTSTWKSSLGRNRTLEQPTIVGGVPAAVLTMAELKKMEAIMFTCFAATNEIDSMSMQGMVHAFRQLSGTMIPLQKQDVIKTRLKEHHAKDNFLYI